MYFPLLMIILLNITVYITLKRQAANGPGEYPKEIIQLTILKFLYQARTMSSKAHRNIAKIDCFLFHLMISIFQNINISLYPIPTCRKSTHWSVNSFMKVICEKYFFVVLWTENSD